MVLSRVDFPTPEVSAEGTEAAFDPAAHLVQALAGIIADKNQRNAAALVIPGQRIRCGKVCLGKDQHRLHILVNGSCRQLVQHQSAGHRLGGTGHNEQYIQIGNGRTDKDIFPGRDLIDHVSLVIQGHIVPRHRRDAPLAEDAAGAAFLDAAVGKNVVESAHALCDIARHS